MSSRITICHLTELVTVLISLALIFKGFQNCV